MLLDFAGVQSERKKKWDEKHREVVTEAHRQLSAFDLVSFSEGYLLATCHIRFSSCPKDMEGHRDMIRNTMLLSRASPCFHFIFLSPTATSSGTIISLCLKSKLNVGACNSWLISCSWATNFRNTQKQQKRPWRKFERIFSTALIFFRSFLRLDFLDLVSPLFVRTFPFKVYWECDLRDDPKRWVTWQ